MRIAVVGPQNVGKTTFVKDFLATFPTYITYTVSYKEVIEKENLQINQDTGERTQEVIMQHLFNTIKNATEKDIIFDRAVIDNYAYSYSAYLKGNVSGEFIKTNKEKMLENLKYLDALFFIPASLLVELKEDKQRDINRGFIDQINRIFMETLLEISKNINIPIHVLSGTREERIEQVKNYLN